MHTAFRTKCLLRISPSRSLIHVHAVADVEPSDAFADALDGSSAVHTWRIGKLRLASVGAGADVRVHGIHPCRVNAHDDFAFAGGWIGYILQAHHFRSAEFMYTDRFHRSLPLMMLLGSAVPTFPGARALLRRWSGQSPDTTVPPPRTARGSRRK